MKKRNSRLLACALAVVLCMTAFSIPTFAAGYYASNENGNNTPPDAIESITVSTENVNLPANSSASGIPALTPDGNLTSIDDILQSAASVSTEDSLENKQFITVQSKSGNTFYIVIDRSGDTENVYFLNLVDEADLMALLEDGQTEETPAACTCAEKCQAGAVNTACPVCAANMSECAGKAPEVEPEPEPEPPAVYDYVGRLTLRLTDSYLSGFSLGTPVKTLISQIKAANQDASVTVTDGAGKSVSDSALVSTGQVLTIRDAAGTYTYTCVVYGDANGDGRIAATDLLAVKKHILKTKPLTGPYARAVTFSGRKIAATALLAVKKHILGTAPIMQK